MNKMRRELEMLRNASLRGLFVPIALVRAERVEPNFQPKVNINAIADLLLIFNGEDADLDRWEWQLKLLKAT